MVNARFASILFLSISCWLGAPVIAQTLSAADILAKVEEKVGGGNEYQVLLNDPDPARSMAAMEVMLESGDPKLVRLALDFGIYSPNPVVQRMALEGYFRAEPRLNVYFSGAEAQKEKQFRERIVDNLGGSIDSSGLGFTAILVGPFNAENQCYPYANDANECLITLSDSGVVIFIERVRNPLKLNDTGELIGEGNLRFVDAPVSLRIPVTN